MVRQNKDFNYQTGEVIRTGYYAGPWFHYGIVVAINGKIYVAHNSTKNEGGCPHLDEIQDFILERYITRSYGVLTNLNANQILDKLNAVKDRRFNYLTWNCEDFVNYVIGKPGYFKLGKIIMVSITAISIAILLYGIYKLTKLIK